jgi:hypothetical protein
MSVERYAVTDFQFVALRAKWSGETVKLHGSSYHNCGWDTDVPHDTRTKPVQILERSPAIFLEGFCAFLQSLQTNECILS